MAAKVETTVIPGYDLYEMQGVAVGVGDRESKARFSRDAVGVIMPLHSETRSSLLDAGDDRGDTDLMRGSGNALGVLSIGESISGLLFITFEKSKLNVELSCPACVPVKKQYWLINSR